MTPRAVIFGCAGAALSAWERDFFAETAPLGFILFQRNCVEPAQVTRLVAELREAVQRQDAPVLIDQEGGRVARLKPPHWRSAPAAAVFGDLALRDRARGREAAMLNAELIATELRELGVNVDCLPLLDLRFEAAHEIIGDRAFGKDPEIVADLGRAVCDGLLAGGVVPIIKHIPGHGRARVDSHETLPVVDATLQELKESDFVAFKILADAPWAMTAHVVYRAVDPQAPATTSPKVIEEIIRGHIGFGGVLVSDDLSMEALSGSLGERAAAALAAGCDIALHCNGERGEMEAVAAAASELTPAAQRRLDVAARRAEGGDFKDHAAAKSRLEALLAAA